jgi:outer membrane protein TolC
MFLAVGCSVGPRYKQPLTTLQPYHNAPEIGSTGALPAPSLGNWWTGFNDTELIKIVDRALSQYLDLAASFAHVAQARAVAQAARANRKPDFDVDGSNTSSRQSIDTPIGRAVTGGFPGFKRNQNFLDLGIGATWETDIFGSFKRAAEAANAEAQAAEAERLGTRLSVAAEAADAYMQIRGAQVRLAFAKEQIETDEHLLQLVSQRRKAGVASDRELAQTEALLSQAQATVPQLNNG